MDSQQRNDEGKSFSTDENKHPDESRNQIGLTHERSVTHNSGSGKKGGVYKEIVEWTKAIVIAVVLVLLIRQFLFSPYIVDGESMEPNFISGERLIVNKILYTFKEPKFGEVVVFDVPEEKRKFIKRVIGVPGDKIRLEGDDLYINDVKVEEPYIKEVLEEAHAKGELYNNTENFPNNTFTESVVPEGMIFAMGDNRSNSRDSRSIGFVKDDEIVGRADIVFWPLNKLEFIKHRY
ncbi:signal peptidase I [Paenibacillus sp. GSMTC-2017]|uniref:signal peptidase I n=1 Tax=Paenibacillus sp. GSMTC-2017 TaxID=2794350 RepID=UPI0018D8E3AD|nr:signal peptidase I [Paenibacillus sp. GSMTC-2017]MBH5316664.1 signal peptidase I [Paenibacillus sp. GSMTC-2017]